MSTPESRKSFDAVAPRLNAAQERIVSLLKNMQATADDVAIALGEQPLFIRPRFSELKSLGVIERAGRGKSILGKPMAVWRLAK